MFKSKKWLNVVVLIFTAVCILLCVCASVMDALNNSSDWSKLSSAAGIISLCFAFYYMANGYSKTEANYFKVFVLLFALTEICTLIGCINPVDIVALIITAIALAMSLVVAFGKNLGKALSLTLVGLIFAAQAASISYSFCVADELANATFGNLSLVNLATVLVLSIVLCIMMIAKYEDKAERGSKK